MSRVDFGENQPHLTPGRLLGRTRELAWLRGALNDGSVAVVLGAAGVGKSYLVANFLAAHDLAAICSEGTYAEGHSLEATTPIERPKLWLRVHPNQHPRELLAEILAELGQIEETQTLPARSAEAVHKLPSASARWVTEAWSAEEAVSLDRALRTAESLDALIVVDDLHHLRSSADSTRFSARDLERFLLQNAQRSKWVLVRHGDGQDAPLLESASLEIGPLPPEVLMSILEQQRPHLDSAIAAFVVGRASGIPQRLLQLATAALPAQEADLDAARFLSQLLATAPYAFPLARAAALFDCQPDLIAQLRAASTLVVESGRTRLHDLARREAEQLAIDSDFATRAAKLIHHWSNDVDGVVRLNAAASALRLLAAQSAPESAAHPPASDNPAVAACARAFDGLCRHPNHHELALRFWHSLAPDLLPDSWTAGAEGLLPLLALAAIAPTPFADTWLSRQELAENTACSTQRRWMRALASSGPPNEGLTALPPASPYAPESAWLAIRELLNEARAREALDRIQALHPSDWHSFAAWKQTMHALALQRLGEIDAAHRTAHSAKLELATLSEPFQSDARFALSILYLQSGHLRGALELAPIRLDEQVASPGDRYGSLQLLQQANVLTRVGRLAEAERALHAVQASAIPDYHVQFGLLARSSIIAATRGDVHNAVTLLNQAYGLACSRGDLDSQRTCRYLEAELACETLELCVPAASDSTESDEPASSPLGTLRRLYEAWRSAQEGKLQTENITATRTAEVAVLGDALRALADASTQLLAGTVDAARISSEAGYCVAEEMGYSSLAIEALLLQAITCACDSAQTVDNVQRILAQAQALAAELGGSRFDAELELFGMLLTGIAPQRLEELAMAHQGDASTRSRATRRAQHLLALGRDGSQGLDSLFARCLLTRQGLTLRTLSPHGQHTPNPMNARPWLRGMGLDLRRAEFWLTDGRVIDAQPFQQGTHILAALHQRDGHASSDSLFSAVWGNSFHRLRHGDRLRIAVSRTNELLENFGAGASARIVRHSDAYQLELQVPFRLLSDARALS